MKSLLLCLTLASLGSSARLEEVKASEYGPNPAPMQLYKYVPDKVAANPPMVVALHPCGGNPSMYHRMAGISSYADRLGFIILYPGTRGQGMSCYDVHSDKSLKHDGGGESQTVSNMVKWGLKKFSADPQRVFITGASSGGMMTDVMAGTYPNLFAAGAPISAAPVGCFAGTGGSTPMYKDQTCARGQKTYSASGWGDLARRGYSGYTGKYPRMQIWHGARDTLVRPKNFDDQLRQWANVHGVQWTKNATNTPRGFTQVVYGDGSKVVGYLSPNGGHVPKIDVGVMLKFFGLM